MQPRLGQRHVGDTLVSRRPGALDPAKLAPSLPEDDAEHFTLADKPWPPDTVFLLASKPIAKTSAQEALSLPGGKARGPKELQGPEEYVQDPPMGMRIQGDGLSRRVELI